MVIERLFTILTSLACILDGAHAQAAPSPERRAILDATRPLAAKEAGQVVRIKVDRLNVDRGYAMLVGELVGAPGKEMNWGYANSCHADLDKMLWVVLRKQRGNWRVLHMEICASEPPYWYIGHYGGYIWPCGVYAGLDEGKLEAECRSGVIYARPPARKRNQ